MNESILISIKKMLGLDEDYTAFDAEITAHINAALMELAQLGVVKEDYEIQDSGNIWAECVVSCSGLEAIRTCIYLKTRILFDPPTSSALMDTLNRTIDRLEWRLNLAGERKTKNGGTA